jgi:hypothetical protein
MGTVAEGQVSRPACREIQAGWIPVDGRVTVGRSQTHKDLVALLNHNAIKVDRVFGNTGSYLDGALKSK